MSVSTLTASEAMLTNAPPGNSAKLRLEVLSPTSRREMLALWREMEVELSSRRLMCSSVWTETWLDHFGSIVPHRFAIGRRGASLCGIALLASGVGQHAGPFPLHTWHLGTAGEPDKDSACIEYNSLLARDEDRVEFAAALWDWAYRQSDCDQLHMDGFAANDVEPLLAAHPGAIVERKSSCYFDLRETRESGADPISRLGYHTRAAIRRSLRLLDNPRGEWAETPARAEEILREMIELHQARWTAIGQPGAYASQRFCEFHFDLLRRLVTRGEMGLFRVTTSTGPVGCVQVLIDDNRALLYQAGWTAMPGKVSPGLVTDYLCLDECLRRGFDAYDFLAGESEHKRRLSTHEAQLIWAIWKPPRLKNTVLDSLRSVKRLFKRLEET